MTIAQLFLMFISILSGVLAGYLTAMYVSFVLVTCLFILYYSVKLKRHTPYLAPLHWWGNRHLLVVFYGVLTLLFAYAVYYLLLNFVFGPPFPILANLFIPYLDLLPIGEISMEELSWLLVIVDGGFYSLISALVISMLVNRIKLFAIILPPALLLSLGYWLSMIGMLYFSEVIPYYLFGGFISHFSNHFVSHNSLYYVAVFHLMIIFVVNINKRKSDAMLEDCP